MNKTLEIQITKYLRSEQVNFSNSLLQLFEAISTTYDNFEKDRLTAVDTMSSFCQRHTDSHDQLQKSLIDVDRANFELISFFEKIDHVYFEVDMSKALITYISPVCVKIYGHTVEEFHMNNNLWLEMISPDDLDIVKIAFSTLRKGIACSPQYRIRHKDNSVRWLETKLTPTLNTENRIIKLDGITSDITKRKLTEDALKLNNEELKKINYELDAFVYSVSHDLRAPLTSVLGIVDIIEEECSDKFINNHLNLVKESINKLDDFIKDIIENSNNSNLELKSEEINFYEILTQVIEKAKHNACVSKSLQFKIDFKNEIKFYSDKFRIKTILNNLIENAIQYQNPIEPNPLVSIEIDMSEKESTLLIKDNGIGICNEKIQNIFDIFYRGCKSSTGSGLGLYVVKEMITKLNGNIEVQSTPGIGTEFRMVVPNYILSCNTTHSK